MWQWLAGLAMPQELGAAAECNSASSPVLPGLRSIVMRTAAAARPAAEDLVHHEAQHEASYWPPTGLCRSAECSCTLLQKY